MAPDGWILLVPGDLALTRRVKTAAEHWVVQEKRDDECFQEAFGRQQQRFPPLPIMYLISSSLQRIASGWRLKDGQILKGELQWF